MGGMVKFLMITVIGFLGGVLSVAMVVDYVAKNDTISACVQETAQGAHTSLARAATSDQVLTVSDQTITGYAQQAWNTLGCSSYHGLTLQSLTAEQYAAGKVSVTATVRLSGIWGGTFTTVRSWRAGEYQYR